MNNLALYVPIERSEAFTIIDKKEELFFRCEFQNLDGTTTLLHREVESLSHFIQLKKDVVFCIKVKRRKDEKVF